MMNRFVTFALLAAVSATPLAASAAEPTACSLPERAGAALTSSGLSCTQWVAQFGAPHADMQARNDRAAAPRS